jgi:hypothetical protein
MCAVGAGLETSDRLITGRWRHTGASVRLAPQVRNVRTCTAGRSSKSHTLNSYRLKGQESVGGLSARSRGWRECAAEPSAPAIFI